MKRSKLRLSLFSEFFVYLIFGILLVTGVAWMVFQARLDEGNQVSSLMLKLHGGAAMVSLILLGALINHMRKGWESRKNRTSGLTLVLVILFLVVTGYGLYYAGDEQLRSLISQWHAWIGLGIVLLLPAHVLIGRAYRRKGNGGLSDDRVRRSLLRSFGRILGVAKSEAAGVPNDGAKSESAGSAINAGIADSSSSRGL